MARLSDLPHKIHLMIAGCLLDSYSQCEDIATTIFPYSKRFYGRTHNDTLALAETTESWKHKALNNAYDAIMPDVYRFFREVDRIGDQGVYVPVEKKKLMWW